MATERELIENTIIALKRFRKRKAYDSESDEELANRDNRGQKLKKRARFVRHGQLAPPTGPEVYKEIVNHAGYERTVISRNPPLINDEGYELDPDDDEEQIQDLLDSVVESDPYASLRLEHILAPLTSVTDLPSHPTLSRPYTSQTLSDLAHQGSDLMHKENAALWKIKHLQTRLNGDHTWAPSELMIGANDLELFEHDFTSNTRSEQGSVIAERKRLMDSIPEANGINGQRRINGEYSGEEDKSRAGKQPATTNGDAAEPSSSMTDADKAAPKELTEDVEMQEASGPGEKDIEGSSKSTDTMQRDGAIEESRSEGAAAGEPAPSASVSNGVVATAENGDDKPNASNADGSQIATTAMSITSEVPNDLFIHPLFLAPRSAHPDRDLGLPETEAEEVRRLLQAFIQKQEEVCRGSKRLYEGLLRADRLRKTVFQWSKYEAHAGPNRDMSDGEDWYDKEEWGLEEDLKKGQDEEEEDTTQPAKKTRARRQ